MEEIELHVGVWGRLNALSAPEQLAIRKREQKARREKPLPTNDPCTEPLRTAQSKS